ncbi:hypothetical protein SBRCBS47491_004534 [Sporothrix bragantina]|uniref:Major facilitator superfamily (MFS) profile domain-containing protein n=1 Tax=Sporothrix bragantina TaxID=671064 RepID=A0ABP0BPC2_9PEZI
MLSKPLETEHFRAAAHIEHRTEQISYNVNARIVNPLADIAKPELPVRVGEFCDKNGFSDKEDVFYRGAIAAQDPLPDAWDAHPELTDDDKYWLKREITHKWHLPRHLYYAIALCSLGSAIQGWDNTGANGANLWFPQEFGIEDRSWLIDRPSRYHLRLGISIKVSVIPIYTAEVSPAFIRGGMIGPLAWRFQLGPAFVPAVPVVFFVWWCPESPRWLIKKGRYHAAFTSFYRLRTITICINNVVGNALGLTFPSLLDHISPTGAFNFHAGLNIIAFLVIFVLIPETKQRTLEELDCILSVPTRRHAAYQLRH